MSLIRLDIANFRNLNTTYFEPLPAGFNFIYGNNGSGKTSLLEAIYYLGLGKSFRSVHSEHIIRKTADKFSLFANLATSNQQFVPMGIERHKEHALKIRLAGKDVASITVLTELLPILLINSDCHNLLIGGPFFRRKYLDWGTFYLQPEFLRIWRFYKQSVKQRNAALVQKRSLKEIQIWDAELTDFGTQLDKLRQDTVKDLVPLLQSKLSELLPKNIIDSWDLSVEYYPGWKWDLSLQEVLSSSYHRDLQLGYTQFGPHRADLKIRINHLPAKDILSRGQQKLFVCAMILAQGELLYNRLKKMPIYLVDDLPSELDLTSRSNLVSLLSKQEAQVFVTAVEPGVFTDCRMSKPVKLFHVEHGNLTSCCNLTSLVE